MAMLLGLYLYRGDSLHAWHDVAVGGRRVHAMDVLSLCTQSTSKTQSWHSIISARPSFHAASLKQLPTTTAAKRAHLILKSMEKYFVLVSPYLHAIAYGMGEGSKFSTTFPIGSPTRRGKSPTSTYQFI